MSNPMKKLTTITIIALLVLTTSFVGTDRAVFALEEEEIPPAEAVLPAEDTEEPQEETESLPEAVPEMQPEMQPTEEPEAIPAENAEAQPAGNEETLLEMKSEEQVGSSAEKPVLKTSLSDVAINLNMPYTRSINDKVTISPAKGRTVQLYRYDKYLEKWTLEKTFTTPKKETATIIIKYPNVWKAYSDSKWKIVCPKFETEDSILAKTEQTVKISSKIVNAKAAVVMDAETGEVMYAQNARDHLKIASMTKMVTMMVVCDKVKLSKKVKITGEAVQARKRSGGMGLRKGDVIRMKDLVHATLMESANDAAAAAACGVSGSQKKFAKLMKKKAVSIGATETTFKYAYGDWHSNTHSTAYDQALIGREFMTNPKYSNLRSIVKKHSYKFNTLKKKKRYTVRMGEMSTSLIRKGCSIGIKSGYNPPAGYCYANAWKHDGKTYISVVMGASSSKKLVSAQKALIKFGNYSADKKLTRITVK